MYLNYARENVLKAMRAKAEELHLQGVSVVLVVDESDSRYQDPLIEVVGRFVDEACATRDWSETGANYWAIAMSKIAEMLETGKSSGTSDRPARKGEFGYRGGVFSKRNGLKIFIAFSGGTEGEDVRVSQFGMVAINKALNADATSSETQKPRPAFLRGDKVLLGLPAEPEKNWEKDTIECVVLQGDTGSEGRLFHADTYVLQTRQENQKRGILNGDMLSGIKLEQMIHM